MRLFVPPKSDMAASSVTVIGKSGFRAELTEFYKNIALMAQSGIPLFNSLHVKLPLATRILLWFSIFLEKHGVLAIGGVLGTVAVLYLARTLKPVRWLYHTIAIRMPFLGSLVRNYQLALFCQIFG